MRKIDKPPRHCGNNVVVSAKASIQSPSRIRVQSANPRQRDPAFLFLRAIHAFILFRTAAAARQKIRPR